MRRSPRIWLLALGGSLALHLAALAAACLWTVFAQPEAHVRTGDVEGVRVALVTHVMRSSDSAREQRREQATRDAMRPVAAPISFARSSSIRPSPPTAARIAAAELTNLVSACSPDQSDRVEVVHMSEVRFNDSKGFSDVTIRASVTDSSATMETEAAPLAHVSAMMQGIVTPETEGWAANAADHPSGASGGIDCEPVSNASNRPPKYPAESRRRGESGTVTLRIVVEADGRVSKIAVESSSGFDRLDESAVQAVRGWQFQPAQSAGSPTRCEIVLPVCFVLRL